ncbi:MAG TPA: hypothetical protein VFR48_11520 [Solirubrobacteraceae bacterium]|nr:hypothetical protein [Solirubrobacteraceae bacterium]
MAKTQASRPRDPSPDPDLLAAVVLDTLVRDRADSSEKPNGLTLGEIVRACEREPMCACERQEVQAALDILLADELATREADRYRPTRAAIRAAELSF